MSSDPTLVSNVQVTEPLGSGNHNVVRFEISADRENEDWKEQYFDYRNAKHKDMRKEFAKLQ